MRTNNESAIRAKRKNRYTHLLIFLLLFIVTMTSVFLGTFSKYLTSETVSEDADVAKFGLNVPNSINLFSDSYTNVQADENGKKIIAPGTDGSYKFNVTGVSEVAYEVTAEISVEYSEEWSDYAPLEFSIDGLEWTSFEDFETNLAVALKSKVMPPNTQYSSTQTIYWRWPFFVSEEYDIKDTAMGQLASAGTAPTVTVEMTVTAVQVD